MRDDGEVHPAHTTFEHGVTDDVGKQGRNRQHGKDGEWQALERLPEPWQSRELVPVHKVRYPWRRLNFGTQRIRGFQLEEHRHGVTPEAEKDPLAQAEDAAMPPQHDQADRNKGVSQVFTNQVEAEDIYAQWQHNEDDSRQDSQANHPLLTTQYRTGFHFFP